MVSFENCKDIANGSFFKSKNITKEKVLNKSTSLVKIFEVVFLGVPSYKVHTFDIYKTTYLCPSIF
jgi:hypothetical protein